MTNKIAITEEKKNEMFEIAYDLETNASNDSNYVLVHSGFVMSFGVLGLGAEYTEWKKDKESN